MENSPCPSCHSTDVDRIVYGFLPPPPWPDEHIRPGGCILIPGGPDFHCNACGKEWAEEDSGDAGQ